MGSNKYVFIASTVVLILSILSLTYQDPDRILSLPFNTTAITDPNTTPVNEQEPFNSESAPIITPTPTIINKKEVHEFVVLKSDQEIGNSGLKINIPEKWQIKYLDKRLVQNTGHEYILELKNSSTEGNLKFLIYPFKPTFNSWLKTYSPEIIGKTDITITRIGNQLAYFIESRDKTSFIESRDESTHSLPIETSQSGFYRDKTDQNPPIYLVLTDKNSYTFEFDQAEDSFNNLVKKEIFPMIIFSNQL